MKHQGIHKNLYWQMIRGICILAVIMIHCPSGQGYSTLDYHTWIILRQVINFPVAIFFFLSGYFMTAEKMCRDYKTFLVRRGGHRLLLPYLFWSGLYLIKDAFLNGITLKHIIYSLMFGKAATPFYYIIVLLQLTAISPWLIKHRKNWMYLITPVHLVLIYTYNIIIGSMPRLYETVFPAWFFFYIFGIDCRSGKFDGLIEKVKGYWIIVALLLSICETYALRAVGCEDGFIVTQIKFSSFLYAVTICLWLQKAKHHVEVNVLTMIGDYSYGIFYCHILVLVFVRKMIQLFALDSIWTVNFGLCFVVTAIGSETVICLTRYILNKIKCEKIIPLIGF